MARSIRVATSPARVILHEHPARLAREQTVGGERMPLAYARARRMPAAQVAAVVAGAVAAALACTAAVVPW